MELVMESCYGEPRILENCMTPVWVNLGIDGTTILGPIRAMECDSLAEGIWKFQFLKDQSPERPCQANFSVAIDFQPSKELEIVPEQPCFNEFFNTKAFVDAVRECEGQSFPAYPLIIAGKSHYFHLYSIGLQYLPVQKDPVQFLKPC